MNWKKNLIGLFILVPMAMNAQENPGKRQLKLKHAEPLYVDLIRDLGARKGEKEWNMGWGMKNEKTYTLHSGFVEYEFCPWNRLGLEVEVPFSFYQAKMEKEKPLQAIHGIRLAAQYTFFVKGKQRLSAAFGYIYEMEMPFSRGHSHSPFLVVAKRWGTSFHSLLYTGPVFHYASLHRDPAFQVNASFHYAPDDGTAFFGLEVNEVIGNSSHSLLLRPQVKVKLSGSSSLGIAGSIPLIAEEGVGFLLRFIYESSRKK